MIETFKLELKSKYSSHTEEGSWKTLWWHPCEDDDTLLCMHLMPSGTRKIFTKNGRKLFRKWMGLKKISLATVPIIISSLKSSRHVNPFRISPHQINERVHTDQYMKLLVFSMTSKYKALTGSLLHHLLDPLEFCVVNNSPMQGHRNIITVSE